MNDYDLGYQDAVRDAQAKRHHNMNLVMGLAYLAWAWGCSRIAFDESSAAATMHHAYLMIGATIVLAIGGMVLFMEYDKERHAVD